MYIFFNMFPQNIDSGYMLEPPRQGGSNEYPHISFGPKIRIIGLPLYNPVLQNKNGVSGVIYFTDMFS